MKIAGVASAFPEHSYAQEVITAALKAHWGAKLERPGLIERLHSHAAVKRRHLAYPIERYPEFKNWGETNAAWIEAAPELGARAVDGALERAGLARRDLDALYVVSITGIASPSLDAKLINRMGLRPDLKRTPIFGLGCVAGATGLSRAADYVHGYPDQVAAILSVELCSLTIQRDDISTVNLISSGLFGDGAVAAVVAGRDRLAHGPPEVVATRSVFYPGTEDIMGWDISEKGFSIVLSPKLPELIRCRLAGDVDAFLREHRLTRGDLGSWVIHPGGPKVLEAVECALGLGSRELEASWECLSRVGNLSSGSVLCVLEETLEHRRPAPGTMGLILAMGPGFCSEMLLVRW
ncbi:MAG TPA: 3-oxoacyl-[acyl-carrier-protein] synthase III C-terminal domain-containing protein [Candidatus Binataceae bacterium]|nr:3-oxoacyl-[acyl-carrier-protein] synthase III C-terminal domain-containing protein [Candidatus Binataceae bacterium]